MKKKKEKKREYFHSWKITLREISSKKKIGYILFEAKYQVIERLELPGQSIQQNAKRKRQMGTRVSLKWLRTSTEHAKCERVFD
jgi:hypothetical protein